MTDNVNVATARDVFEMLIPNQYRVSRNKFFWRFSKLKTLKRTKKDEVDKVNTVYKSLADGVYIKLCVYYDAQGNIGIFAARRGKSNVKTTVEFSVYDGSTGSAFITHSYDCNWKKG